MYFHLCFFNYKSLIHAHLFSCCFEKRLELAEEIEMLVLCPANVVGEKKSLKIMIDGSEYVSILFFSRKFVDLVVVFLWSLSVIYICDKLS